MDYQTKDLILHFVTEDDLSEVARTWPSDHHPLSDAEAKETIVMANTRAITKTRIRVTLFIVNPPFFDERRFLVRSVGSIFANQGGLVKFIFCRIRQIRRFYRSG